jgi:transcriptional regulator with XRE-family HTH domain
MDARVRKWTALESDRMMSNPTFATNLRRLLLFEHRSGKEAAEALGVTEATVSRWLTGKRYPSAEALIAIEKLYDVSPRDLDADPVDFAQKLADPDRMNYVAIGRESGRMEITKRRVAEIKRRQAERVVPIEKGRKKK